jgi:branched-chain amino acid transport system permease protein
MLALGLNIVVGYAGLLDLGYVAFYAVGAYMYALLASPHLAENFEWIAATFPHGLHNSIWLVVPLGAGLAAVFGVLLGAPTLRLRGDYLAIVTLGFGEIIRIFMNNLNAPVNLTNGPQGIGNIDPVRIAAASLGSPAGDPRDHVRVGAALLLPVPGAGHRGHRRHRAAAGLRASDAPGWPSARTRSRPRPWASTPATSSCSRSRWAHRSGACPAAMFAAFQGFVSPESFSLNESIIIVSMVVLGGMGHVPGVILGAVLLYAMPETLRHVARPAQQWLFGAEIVPAEALRMLLFGLSMVGIMLTGRRGCGPPAPPESRRGRSRIARRNGAESTR